MLISQLSSRYGSVSALYVYLHNHKNVTGEYVARSVSSSSISEVWDKVDRDSTRGLTKYEGSVQSFYLLIFMYLALPGLGVPENTVLRIISEPKSGKVLGGRGNLHSEGVS